jgi:hypothetical protein
LIIEGDESLRVSGKPFRWHRGSNNGLNTPVNTPKIIDAGVHEQI